MSSDGKTLSLFNSESKLECASAVKYPASDTALPDVFAFPTTILVCSPTPPHAPFYASDDFDAVLGLGAREIVGNAAFWETRVHTEDVPQLLSGFFHLFTRGYHIYEYRFLNKHGTYTTLLCEIHLRSRRKGFPVAVLAFLRQMPLLPRADAQAVCFTLDANLLIREVSPSLHTLCGEPSTNILGKSVLELIPSDYIHLANDAFAGIIQRGQRACRFWLAMKHADGGLRFVSAECERLHEGADRRRFAVLRCRDITDLVELDKGIRLRHTKRLLSTLSRSAGMRQPTASDPADGPSPLDRLTAREREILSFIIDGLTSSAIGEKLSISPRTVETHRSHIMKKIGVSSLSQLIRYMVGNVSFFGKD